MTDVLRDPFTIVPMFAVFPTSQEPGEDEWEEIFETHSDAECYARLRTAGINKNDAFHHALADNDVCFCGTDENAPKWHHDAHMHCWNGEDTP